jgi:hypothetical protein
MGSVRVMKSLWICFLHIAALNSFAIAQPVLDRLGANPEYLRLAGYSGTAIVAALLIYLLAIPVCVVAAVAILRAMRRPKSAQAVFGIAATLLFALTINLALRWIQWRFDLRARGLPDFLLAGSSLPLAIGGTWLYRRFEWPGQLLNIAAIGIVLFPASFFSKPTMQAEVLGMTPMRFVGTQAENPVPIVIVAFDGLCAMSLLNEQHEIDAVRYPAFAKLAKVSDFYRNATSVHCRTTQAMPAILTGQFPDAAKVSPVESSHPQNLFRLLHDSGQYEMTVFEPLTRLCPQELRVLEENPSFSEQVSELTSILAQVYLATTLPDDLDLLQLHIPRIWFGFVPDEPGLRVPSKGLIIYAWDSEHEIQIRHFTDTLVKSDKPRLNFLHLVVPHDPWSHLPSGKEYIKSARITEYAAGAFGDLGELWGPDELMVQYGWQRYLLQLQYTDRCLGRILDRLEETGEFDRSLVVVVADHGMAFVPGQERRIPTNHTVADLMSVPLFIKLPEQTIGQTSDLNVETIDVLPTIADIIKLPLEDAVDGESLVAPNYQERPRKTMYFDGDKNVVVNPEFSERFDYVDRMVALFGTGGQDDRLWDLNTIPELVGKDISAFSVGSASQWEAELERGGEMYDAAKPNFVPSYFIGSLKGPKVTSPVQIAVNGRIAGTTRTSTNPSTPRQWTILLREEFFNAATDKARLFEIEQLNGSYALHELFIRVPR